MWGSKSSDAIPRFVITTMESHLAGEDAQAQCCPWSCVQQFPIRMSPERKDASNDILMM